MKKRIALYGGIPVLALAFLAGGLLAGGEIGQWPNASGDTTPVYSFDSISYSVVHDGLQDATILVATADAASTEVRVRGSDCCIPGDLWRSGVAGRRNAIGVGGDFRIDATSNNCAADPETSITVCDPDVFGPDAVITPPAGAGNIQSLVMTMWGNDAPGGLPAGGTVVVETDGSFVGSIGPIVN